MLAQVPAHRFVGYVRDSGRPPWQFRDAKGQAVAFTPTSQFDFGCNSLEIAALAATQEAGIARLPVWPHARAMPLKTRVLIDLLVERLVPALAVR